MYFINHEQIDQRIQFLASLADASQQLEEQWATRDQ